MDVRLINLFMEEILNQANAAMHSAGNLNDLFTLKRQNQIPLDEFITGVFIAIQGILTAGALISKILWVTYPPRAGSAERCEQLRNELGIDAEIPGLNREVRNGFEHIDERIDTYFAGGSHFVDHIIGPPSATIEDDEPMRVLRRFDPETRIVTVLGASISVQELLDAVRDVAGKAQQWQRDNPRAGFGRRGAAN